MKWVVIIIESGYRLQGCMGLFDSEDLAKDAVFGQQSALRTIADTTAQPWIINGARVFVTQLEQTIAVEDPHSGDSPRDQAKALGGKAPGRTRRRVRGDADNYQPHPERDTVERDTVAGREHGKHVSTTEDPGTS